MARLKKGLELFEPTIEDGIVWEDDTIFPNPYRTLYIDKMGHLHIVDTSPHFDKVYKMCPCRMKSHYEERES